MSETVLASGSERQIWINNYFQEYIRYSRFMPYMTNADINKGGIILTRFQKEEEQFRVINIPFVGRLKSTGVTGAQVLDGQEEELQNFNCPITIDWRRNAVRVPKSTSFRTEIDLWNAAKTALNAWGTEKLRDDIIKALSMVITDTAGTCVDYAVATTTQQNTFAANNKDRLLFGNANSNYSATWATAMGNVSSSMKASSAIMGLGKRLLKAADPHIRPFRVDDGSGREFYVAFHAPAASAT